MATTYHCDRCDSAMGTTADASLGAILHPGVESTLRGPERTINADLCRECFMALREFVWPSKLPKKEEQDENNRKA